MEGIKDASHLYEVEHRAQHAARPGFRISELKLSAKQKVPWHYHSNVADTFYVLEGSLRIFLQKPKQEIRLQPPQGEHDARGEQRRQAGETFTAEARRPHLVTNGGKKSVTFLVLQGIGEYDFVPLLK